MTLNIGASSKTDDVVIPLASAYFSGEDHKSSLHTHVRHARASVRRVTRCTPRMVAPLALLMLVLLMLRCVFWNNNCLLPTALLPNHRYAFLGAPSTNDLVALASEPDLKPSVAVLNAEPPLVDATTFRRICMHHFQTSNIFDLTPDNMRLFRRFVFCFLSHNADHHLDNFMDLNARLVAADSMMLPWLSHHSLASGPQKSHYLLNGPDSAAVLNFGKDFIRETNSPSIQQNAIFTSLPERTIKPETIVTSRFMRANLVGRGIVTSFGSQHVSYFAALIMQLQTLGTSLPIEIFVRSDITQAMFKSLKQFTASYSGRVTLIILDNFITKSQREKYKGFSNKILALAFSQFEEAIWFDADAVPFVNPETFFKIDGYVETGIYLFKDRVIGDQIRNKEVSVDKILAAFPADEPYSKSASPSIIQHVKTLRYHLVEAGVVIINRKVFFASLMLAVNLMQAELFLTAYAGGDKEVFWLAPSLLGNANIAMSRFHSVVLGDSEIVEKDNVLQEKVCSTQPVHLSPTGKEILWVNSGLQSCKFDSPVIPPALRAMKGKRVVGCEYDTNTAFVRQTECNGYSWCVFRHLDENRVPQFNLTGSNLENFVAQSVQWSSVLARYLF